MGMVRRLFAISALALAAGCGGGSPSTPTAPVTPATTTPATPATPAPGAVTIVSGARTLGNLAYSPNPITVAAGATVTWTNADSTTHGAVNDGGAFAGGSIAPGGTLTATFSTPGTYAYHCPIHSGMTGSIVVQ